MPENPLSNEPKIQPPEPVIHVIPPEFYGLAVRASIQAPAPVKTTADKPAPAAAPVAPGATTPVVKKEGGKAWVVIPVIAVLVLGALGYFTWQYALKPAAKPVAPETKPAVTLPASAEATAGEPVAAPETPVAPTESASATETATTTPTVAEAENGGAPDADGDGLTDVEEALYGTDARKTDTDGDGFSDSVETINLYDPATPTPAKLINGGHVGEYASVDGKFSIFYPASWTSQANGRDVSFSNDLNQPISVTVVDNPKDISVLDWYLQANPGAKPSQVQQFYTKSNLEGVRGPDGRTAYVSADKRIYIISYAPGIQGISYFRSTFQMMINSFEYRP